jgi:RHS repeat-associated protein
MITDQNGNVVARHDFLPFGEEIQANQAGRGSLYGSTTGVEPKFTGQLRDAETGNDYFKARYYMPSYGRFMSPDPANAGADLYNPQSWNAYAYVLGNPLANVDPSGMDTCPDGSWASLCVTAQGPPPISVWWWFFMNGRFNLLATLVQQSYRTSSGGGGGGANPKQSQQPPKNGTQACVAPNLLQRAGIAVQGLIARISGTAVGFGVGGSFAAGNIFGVSLSVSRQLVVLPNGQAAFTASVTQPTGTAFNSVVSPGIGAYGGLQLSFSNATSVGDLGGSSADYGYGGGAGLAGGVDLSVGSGSKGQRIWQLNLTGGAGVSAPAGVGHGFSFAATSATPICGG